MIQFENLMNDAKEVAIVPTHPGIELELDTYIWKRFQRDPFYNINYDLRRYYDEDLDC